MSSPPLGSPPPFSANSSILPNTGNKRPISLPGSANRSNKKPKPSRKSSFLSTGGGKSNHPLRQTSFPPEESQKLDERSPSVDSLLDASHDLGIGAKGLTSAAVQGENANINDDDDEDEDRMDDYGTTSLLYDGGYGHFGEDDEMKTRVAYVRAQKYLL